MAGDEINLDTGDDAANAIAGKRNVQQTQRNQPSQHMRAGDVYYTKDSDMVQIWLKLADQKIEDNRQDLQDQRRDIRDLDRRMDNLPERVRALENTEVVIRPSVAPDARPEVVIRQLAPQPEASNLSMRTLLIVLIVALGIVIVLVGLLYWQVASAGGT